MPDDLTIHFHVHLGEGDADGDSPSHTQLKEFIMAQIDDLRAAIGQVGVDLAEAVERVNAKITALGEPDEDLTGDIATLRGVSSTLDALATGAVEPPPVEEPPVEEPPATEPPVDETPAVDPNTGGPA